MKILKHCNNKNKKESNKCSITKKIQYLKLKTDWVSQTAEDRNNELEDSATENIQTEAQMEKEKWKKEKRS